MALAAMRVYMHFEEDEPNFTAALTVAMPETTLDQLVHDFLRTYIEHYGEGAADLDADTLELRNAKSVARIYSYTTASHTSLR